jgi:hypothetical protein
MDSHAAARRAVRSDPPLTLRGTSSCIRRGCGNVRAFVLYAAIAEGQRQRAGGGSNVPPMKTSSARRRTFFALGGSEGALTRTTTSWAGHAGEAAHAGRSGPSPWRDAIPAPVDLLDIGKLTRQTYSGGENAHEKADNCRDWHCSGSRGCFEGPLAGRRHGRQRRQRRPGGARRPNRRNRSSRSGRSTRSSRTGRP